MCPNQGPLNDPIKGINPTKTSAQKPLTRHLWRPVGQNASGKCSLARQDSICQIRGQTETYFDFQTRLKPVCSTFNPKSIYFPSTFIIWNSMHIHIHIHIIHIGIHYHENIMSFGRCKMIGLENMDPMRGEACGARTMRPSQAMDHDIFAAG